MQQTSNNDTAWTHCTPEESEQRFPSNTSEQEITIKQNGLITLLQVVSLINFAAPPRRTSVSQTLGALRPSRGTIVNICRLGLHCMNCAWAPVWTHTGSSGRRAGTVRTDWSGSGMRTDDAGPWDKVESDALSRSDKTARRKMKTPMVKVSAM